MYDILNKARDLGESILKSELSEKVNAAREAFDNDMEARETLFDYNAKNRRLQALMDEGKAGTDEFKAAREEYREAAEKLSKDMVIKELIDSEQRFNNFLTQVLNIVRATVVGEEGCGGNCSSCGGCH